MKNTFLIITSIANQENAVLKQFAEETSKRSVPFIVIGDNKSPREFNLTGCDFYSMERQQALKFQLAKILPVNHYSRKNLGYLIAISQKAEVIIETDDDNLPLEGFWENRTKQVTGHLLNDKGWVNVYKYFTETHIWPRGFALEHILDKLPILENQSLIDCPIQQGLADENPDVDAIYRLTLPLPAVFNKMNSIALGKNSFCPFNSQNTTWFKVAFALLYLPSYCNFRMTDIWRSFVAQRIAWTCGWPILFHHSTVRQERNDHNLMYDFRDEISGYINNAHIVKTLNELSLHEGIENIPVNMKLCYSKLIELGFVSEQEIFLLEAWLEDINSLIHY
jgi:hypothetical protein